MCESPSAMLAKKGITKQGHSLGSQEVAPFHTSTTQNITIIHGPSPFILSHAFTNTPKPTQTFLFFRHSSSTLKFQGERRELHAMLIVESLRKNKRLEIKHNKQRHLDPNNVLPNIFLRPTPQTKRNQLRKISFIWTLTIMVSSGLHHEGIYLPMCVLCFKINR